MLMDNDYPDGSLGLKAFSSGTDLPYQIMKRYDTFVHKFIRKEKGFSNNRKFFRGIPEF